MRTFSEKIIKRITYHLSVRSSREIETYNREQVSKYDRRLNKLRASRFFKEPAKQEEYFYYLSVLQDHQEALDYLSFLRAEGVL